MKVYKVKTKRLGGTNYKEVYEKARSIYDKIKKGTKRKTFIRSAYFKRDKIFLDLFWSHLSEKKKTFR